MAIPVDFNAARWFTQNAVGGSRLPAVLVIAMGKGAHAYLASGVYDV